MIGGLLQHSSVPALLETLSFTEARHTLLASNLANLDTPGYEARDLSVQSFQKQLRERLAEMRRPPAAAAPFSELTSPGYDGPPPAEQEPIRPKAEAILRHDGVELSLEREVIEIAKNQSLHSLTASLLRQQLQLLQTAVSERV